MKLLLTHRYFWPDAAPYGQLLKSIADDLAANGHDVHVFSSNPSYRNANQSVLPGKHQINTFSITRCKALPEHNASPLIRTGNALYYIFWLFLTIIRLRPDVVTAATFPPVLAAYVASFASSIVGARFVYHVQDIHPEVSEVAGQQSSRSLFSRLLKWLDNQTLRRASLIIVLSTDMAATLRARVQTPLPIRVLNNFGMDDGGELLRPDASLLKNEGRRRIIFAGNLGRFQNLSEVTKGIARCLDANPDLELLFLGDGVMAPELKRRWKSHPQIKFAPFLPAEQARYLIAESDIGLVSLADGVCKVAYPSKTLTYLSVGIPVLAVVDPGSDLAKSLVSAGVAEVPPFASEKEVEASLNKLLSKSISTSEIVKWYRNEFGRTNYIAEWEDLLADLAHRQTIRCEPNVLGRLKRYK